MTQGDRNEEAKKLMRRSKNPMFKARKATFENEPY